MHRHAARNTRRRMQRKCPHDGIADVRLYFDENRTSGFNRYQHGRVDGGQHLPREIGIDDGTAYHDHPAARDSLPGLSVSLTILDRHVIGSAPNS